MISVLLSRIVILCCGTLYPAYASYKAVRSKNVKEYVKWMMYWIVFALFTCAETFADLFVSWIPFYYEIKIIFVLWLLSPATKGSSILYRRFVHPHFAKREEEIDSYIAQASEQGYYAVVTLGSKGLSYAASMVVQGQAKVIEQIKNYGASEAPVGDVRGAGGGVRGGGYVDERDGMDDELDNRLQYERGGGGAGGAVGAVRRTASAARATRNKEADLRAVEEEDFELNENYSRCVVRDGAGGGAALKAGGEAEGSAEGKKEGRRRPTPVPASSSSSSSVGSINSRTRRAVVTKSAQW